MYTQNKRIENRHAKTKIFSDIYTQTATGIEGGLVSKNVKISGRRTSVRLEQQMWDALRDITIVEKCSIHDICTFVDISKAEKASFTEVLRVYLMLYYKNKNAQSTVQ